MGHVVPGGRNALDPLSMRPEVGDWLLESLRHAEVDDVPDRKPVNLDEICELLQLDRHTAARTYANALVMTLTEALGAVPDIRGPGTVDLSFDEAWLMRLVERAQAHDDESVAFLISSRVPLRHRPAIIFLVEGLAMRLDRPG